MLQTVMAFFFCVGFLTGVLRAEEKQYTDIIERPESHIWDRDDLYRNNPEALLQLSKTLKKLKEDNGLEVYLVIYSSLIGEKTIPLSRRCHKEWLGEENDGLVFVVSFNEGMMGAIGRSENLYNGHFIEEGILPRISYNYVQEVSQTAFLKVEKEKSEVEQLRIFFDFMSGKFKERLAMVKTENASKESYHFMGWMALALLACGILMGFLSKLVGAADRRSKKVYHFPDFVVPQRLRAPNGGGKIGVVDFE